MANVSARRRFAAILFADVVGYSRLTEIAEEATHRRLMQLRSEVLEPSFAAHRGRMIKSYGDGFLAFFDDLDSALGCAVSLQKEITQGEKGTDPDKRIAFRMALNFCDVILEQDDVYGDGVNIAARLQAYA